MVHGSAFRGSPISLFPTDDVDSLLGARSSDEDQFHVTNVQVPSSFHTAPFAFIKASPRVQDPADLSRLLQDFPDIFERQDQDRIAVQEDCVWFVNTIHNMVTSFPPSCSASVMCNPVTLQAVTPAGSCYPAPSIAPTGTCGRPSHSGVMYENTHPVYTDHQKSPSSFRTSGLPMTLSLRFSLH
jgi:hypothetical protein